MSSLRSVFVALAAVTAMICVAAGCVRRTLTIETEPQGAIVTLNDQEIGPSPVSRDFTWYGDYNVVIRKEGFETLHTHANLKAPWYQVPPIDFFSDVLWPGRIHDEHTVEYTLEPKTPRQQAEVLSRALEMREQTLTKDH